MQIKVEAAAQELSELQKKYRKFVKDKLKEHNKGHPFQGSDDEVAEFMDNLSQEWQEYKDYHGLESKKDSE